LLLASEVYVTKLSPAESNAKLEVIDRPVRGVEELSRLDRLWLVGKFLIRSESLLLGLCDLHGWSLLRWSESLVEYLARVPGVGAEDSGGKVWYF
jgi:hypothetical protein